jgi:hypothetical protein
MCTVDFDTAVSWDTRVDFSGHPSERTPNIIFGFLEGTCCVCSGLFDNKEPVVQTLFTVRYVVFDVKHRETEFYYYIFTLFPHIFFSQ